MQNHFLLPADSRLEHWKGFRKTLSEMSDDIQKFQAVADYWATAPLLNIAYDPEAPNTWPTIWEMIRTGDWCRNSVAIGMEGTLRLSGIDPKRLMLGLLLDQDVSMMTMVVQVDTKWLLNYDWGILTKRPKTRHRWLRRFQWSGRFFKEF